MPADARTVAASVVPDRFQPWLLGGLAALCVGRPLLPSEAAALGDGLLWALLALLALTVSVVRVVLLPTRSLIWTKTETALAVWWLLLAGSTGVALATGYARPALNLAWEATALAATYLLARQVVRSQVAVRGLLVVMFALAVGLAADGIYQAYIELPAVRAAFAAAPDKAAWAQEQGLTLALTGRDWETFSARLNSTEPFATFALTNSLAGFLLPWLIVGIGCGWLAYRGQTLVRSRQLALLASLGVIAFCLLLTKSRTAYLALAMALAGLGMISGLQRGRMLPSGKLLAIGAGGLAALGLLAWFAGLLDHWLVTEAGKSLGYRLQYWQATGQMIAQHPWLGIGPGQFGDQYIHFKAVNASEEISDPHNAVLELTVLQGGLGLLAMLAFGGCWLHQVWQKPAVETAASPVADPVQNRAALAELRWIGWGGAAGLVCAWATAWAVEFPMPLIFLGFLLWVYGGVWWLLRPWILRGSLTAEGTSIRPWLGTALVALGINLLAAGGWLYPGVAGTGWLLMALLLVRPGVTETDQPTAINRGWACGLLGILVALLIASQLTAYQPVSASRTHLNRARALPFGSVDAVAELEAAAAADPWGADAPQYLAETYLQRALSSGASSDWEQFTIWSDEFARRRGNNDDRWRTLAGWYDRAAADKGEARWQAAAVAAWQAAAGHYPHSAERRANWALALQQTDPGQAAEVARQALALDTQMPHQDKKLTAELSRELKRIAQGGVAGPKTQ